MRSTIPTRLAIRLLRGPLCGQAERLAKITTATVTLIIGVLLVLLTATLAQASWVTDGVLLADVPEPDPLSGDFVPDGTGGIIAVWLDGRAGIQYNGIYAQRMNTQGKIVWPGDGIAISADVGTAAGYAIAEDGAAGAIIAWLDDRAGSYDIYAQRIDANGSLQWSPGGVAVCTHPANQTLPKITSDGSGGAIITWDDDRTNPGDIYAQRISSDGTVLWSSDGEVVCSVSQSFEPQITSDGAAGAIISWIDYRNGNGDIFAQRILADGAAAWATNGVALCTETGQQSDQRIVADGFDGAIVTWVDFRNVAQNGDIYAQLINEYGIVQWGVGGRAICSDAASQLSPQLTPDGLGGAIVAWEDRRSGNADIYAQRVNSIGSILWPLDGAPMCQNPETQQDPSITTDGSQGAIITWQDFRNPDSEIYKQRVDWNGNVLWGADGWLVCSSPGSQSGAKTVSDGAGGAFIAWQEGAYWAGIYAQRIDDTGVGQWTCSYGAVCVAVAQQGYQEMIADGSGGTIISWVVERDFQYEVYVQRIDANGDLQWSTAGTRVAVDFGRDVQITSDGADGAIVTWSAGWSGENDIYAQSIDGTGAARWTANGVLVCGAADNQYRPRITTDGAGGAILTWVDPRDGSNDQHIYAQRIDATGNVLWTPDGVAVCTRSPGYQWYPEITSDELGGAIIAWEERPDEPLRDDFDIYAQRIDANGNALWTPDGEAICTIVEPLFTYLHDIRLIADETSGAIITWADHRIESNDNIFAQRIDANGTVRWTVDGKAIATASGDEQYPQIAPDGTGGAIITYALSGTSIYAQRIDAAGTILWTPGGEAICTAPDQQHSPQITADGAGGAVITWADLRDGYPNSDIYAQRIDAAGNVRWTTDGEPITTHLEEKQNAPKIVSDGSGGAIITWEDGRDGVGVGSYGIYAQRIHGASCEISPTNIDFGTIKVFDAREKTFIIRNTSDVGNPLSGTVSESCDHYSIVSGSGPYTVAPGDSVVVTVRFEPTDVGPHNCTVETGEVLCSDVNLTGVGSAPVPCSVQPSTVNFDRVLVGASKDTTFTIGYFGTSTLSGTISESSPHYSIVSGAGPFTLAPGESLVVGLRYAPTAPGTHRALIETGSSACNRRVLVADGQAGLLLLDARDPASVASHGDYDTPGRSWAVEVVGTRAFVADGTAGLQVIDVSDPSAPALLGAYDTPLVALDVTVLWNLALVADNTSGLQIIDVGDPAAPSLLGAYDTPGAAGGVAARGDLAFVADGSGGLVIIDVSTPSLPALVGTYVTPGGALDVAVYDNLAFVADYTSGLQIIDISTPSTPALIGTLDTPGEANGVAVRGDLAFVADGAGGLLVVDVSFPSIPTLLAAHPTGAAVYDVAVEGHYVYAGSGLASAEIDVVDVTDPSNPFSVATYDTPNLAYGVTVMPGGDVACVGYAAHAYAVIDSVADVPNDQGGWARVHFTRSHYDSPSETQYPVTGYDVHRRVDDASLAAIVLSAGEPIQDDVVVELPGNQEIRLTASHTEVGPEYLRYEDRYFLVDRRGLASSPPGLWEVVGHVSAQQRYNYICAVPTLGDSSATIPYTVLYISAHTTTPAVFFNSPTDSGYSVDNIAPGVPSGLAVAYNTGVGNTLTWEASEAPDFQYFKIYRDTDPDFVPGAGNLVHATEETSWSDPAYDGWPVIYKITALDHAGNESPPASHTSATHVPDDVIPGSFALYQNAPNPFNPITTIRYDVPAGGGKVSLRIYNVEGRLISTLFDDVQSAGQKSITWDGSADKGRKVASGIYFYRMTAPGYTKTRKMLLLQ